MFNLANHFHSITKLLLSLIDIYDEIKIDQHFQKESIRTSLRKNLLPEKDFWEEDKKKSDVKVRYFSGNKKTTPQIIVLPFPKSCGWIFCRHQTSDLRVGFTIN